MEFYARAQELKNVATPPAKILLDQIFINGIFTAILWIAGLVWFFIGKERAHYRWRQYETEPVDEKTATWKAGCWT